jgi:hypothetical protein
MKIGRPEPVTSNVWELKCVEVTPAEIGKKQEGGFKQSYIRKLPGSEADVLLRLSPVDGMKPGAAFSGHTRF